MLNTHVTGKLGVGKIWHKEPADIPPRLWHSTSNDKFFCRYRGADFPVVPRRSPSAPRIKGTSRSQLKGHVFDYFLRSVTSFFNESCSVNAKISWMGTRHFGMRCVLRVPPHMRRSWNEPLRVPFLLSKGFILRTGRDVVDSERTDWRTFFIKFVYPITETSSRWRASARVICVHTSRHSKAELWRAIPTYSIAVWDGEYHRTILGKGFTRFFRSQRVFQLILVYKI